MRTPSRGVLNSLGNAKWINDSQKYYKIIPNNRNQCSFFIRVKFTYQSFLPEKYWSEYKLIR